MKSLRVESLVDSRRPYRHVGMQTAQPFHALRRRQHRHKPDLPGAPLLEPDYGRRCRIRRRDDRGDDDDEALTKVRRRFEKIFDRDEQFWLAIKADMGDASRRHEVEHAFGKSDSGAQDWREYQFLAGKARRHHARHRRFDFNIGQRQVPGHLVTQQHPDLLEELTEGFGRDVLVADQRQLVLDQRMFDDRDAFHISLRLCSENGAVANDFDRWRAVGASVARDLATRRPGAAFEHFGERQGGRVHVEPAPQRFRQPVEQGDG